MYIYIYIRNVVCQKALKNQKIEETSSLLKEFITIM